MFVHAGNRAIITTHSPYILGEFNNLLYANEIHGVDEQRNEIVDKKMNAKTISHVLSLAVSLIILLKNLTPSNFGGGLFPYGERASRFKNLPIRFV